MDVHDSLWQSALVTAEDLAARLSVIHCVHEARGLDVWEGVREKLERCGDGESVAVLETNIKEEVGHVAKGVKWLQWLCERDGRDASEEFSKHVEQHFRGKIKPPFNYVLRDEAKMPRAWYSHYDKTDA